MSLLYELLSPSLRVKEGVCNMNQTIIAPESKYHTGDLLSPKCTDDMTEEEWLEAREHGPDGDRDYTIGGSSIATVLGLNPYETVQELWDEKKGVNPIVPKADESDIFARGHLLEEPIARLLEKDLREIYGDENVYVEFDKYMYGCSDTKDDGSLKYPYMVINYDCNIKIRINGQWKFYLGEIKTTNSTSFDVHRNWRNGIVPVNYEYQCRYYMKALDVDGIFICCAWGFDKNDRAHVFIERDIAIEEDMLEAADAFVQSLRDNVPPDPKNTTNAEKLLSYYARKYAIAKERGALPFEIPEEYRSDIQMLITIDDELCKITSKNERLVQRRNEILVKMYPMFEKSNNGNFALSENKTIYIKRKISYKRDKFDEERFKKEEPRLYSEFMKDSGKLDLTGLKKKYKAVAGKYVIPGEPTGKTTFDINVWDHELGTSTQRIEAPFGWKKEVKHMKGA